MKKIWIPILAILLSLLVLAGALVYLLVALPKMTGANEPVQEVEFPTVEEYLAQTWPDYRFVGLDDGVLMLEYALSGSFEQLQKHGLAAGYDAVAAGNVDTGKLIIHGCNLQCNTVLREVVILGMSEDGQQAYRASTLDGVTACWD